MSISSRRLAMVSSFILLACSACNVTVTEVEGEGGAGGSSSSSSTSTSSSSSGTGGTITPVEPEEGVAQDITLSVYSNGWGDLLGTIEVDSEGPVVIDVEDPDPYGSTPQFYVYATADGFYTELYDASFGETINVDLDAVPEAPDAIAGVVFAQQGYFADFYFAGQTLQLVGPGIDEPITTDAQGRYGFQSLPAGTYELKFLYQGQNFILETINATETTDYADLGFMEPAQAS
ncbi:MAG: carboxypeptidase regulatory-like domain-containing protein [Deltaproteobacteria bacterium]|nr:carboxypeptidase regulatory-like domain-containing protein [Deltaproteobacteria bacterium]